MRISKLTIIYIQVYSGISGLALFIDVFVGVVYYQRLRHMIADKSQVRSSGPVHQLTMQPVKGRKRHGGIRLGEMERDSLLAHGAVFVLQDRLLECSDLRLAIFCENSDCLGLSVPIKSDVVQALQSTPRGRSSSEKLLCCRCQGRFRFKQIKMPYVFRCNV